MTEPLWAWEGVLVTGSERGWFTVLQRELLTQNSIVSFTAHPDTQRNLDVWLLRTFYFFFLILKLFRVKLRPGGGLTSTQKAEAVTLKWWQLHIWFWHNVCELHVYCNSVITWWATQKEILAYSDQLQQPWSKMYTWHRYDKLFSSSTVGLLTFNTACVLDLLFISTCPAQ